MSELLDTAFVRELQVLKRRLDVQARSHFAGDRLALRRGSSAEFEQHRSYIAGDDVRRVDWAATARSGNPVIKLFRAEEDPIVRVLLDRSLSLASGTPNKLLLGKRLAAALGYLGLHSSARVQLLCGPSEVPDKLQFFDQRRGSAGLLPWLRQLDAITAQGQTQLARWVRDAVARTARPGLLAVISDFLDPEAVLRELDLARSQGHEIALVQVLSPQEMAPEFEGDIELEDVETGQRVELTLDQDALNTYLANLLGLLEHLRAWARQRGCAYVRVTREEELVPAMRRLVAREQD
jgi:uncharacterized protein (DUF58 family)